MRRLIVILRKGKITSLQHLRTAHYDTTLMGTMVKASWCNRRASPMPFATVVAVTVAVTVAVATVLLGLRLSIDQPPPRHHDVVHHPHRQYINFCSSDTGSLVKRGESFRIDGMPRKHCYCQTFAAITLNATMRAINAT